MIVLVVIAFCCLPFVLNALYKHTNRYNNQFVDVRKFWTVDGIAHNLQIINVGSNHPKFGFDYSHLDVNGANLAVGPQTFEYDFTILRKVTNLLQPKAVVVLPICLQKFFLYRQTNRNSLYKYYTFLAPSEIVGYNKWEKIRNIDYPLLFNPFLVKALIKDSPKDKRLELSYNPLISEFQLKSDADFWINCWNKEFNINIPALAISERNRDDITKNIQILKEMISYCRKHGFQPIIALLPVTEYLSSRFSEEYLREHLYRYINESNESNAPIMNYLHDKRFTDPSLYINSFFFNQKGRRLFTQTFINDLKAKALL